MTTVMGQLHELAERAAARGAPATVFSRFSDDVPGELSAYVMAADPDTIVLDTGHAAYEDQAYAAIRAEGRTRLVTASRARSRRAERRGGLLRPRRRRRGGPECGHPARGSPAPAARAGRRRRSARPQRRRGPRPPGYPGQQRPPPDGALLTEYFKNHLIIVE